MPAARLAAPGPTLIGFAGLCLAGLLPNILRILRLKERLKHKTASTMVSSMSSLIAEARFALEVLVRLPWWFISSILPATRLKRTWSVKRSTMVHLLKFAVRRLFTLGITEGTTHRKLHLSKGVMGTFVDPVPDSFIKGSVESWARMSNIEPIQLPGYWYHKRSPASSSSISMGQAPLSPSEKVLYFLHGGAYVSLSAHPSSTSATIPKNLVKFCSATSTDVNRCFAIEYRLCKADGAPWSDENPGPFPAALLDALSGYYYLVHHVGFSPEQIIIAGDSAGGNLALAVTRYLVESKLPNLGVPGGLILLSPWTDLSDSHSVPGGSFETNSRSDYVDLPRHASTEAIAPREFVRHSLKSSAAVGNAFFENAYISPCCQRASVGDRVSFKGFPPTFINAGGSEILLDQITRLRRLMERDIGSGNVEYLEKIEAVHDYLCFEWFEPERGETLRAIAAWVSGLSSSSSTSALDSDRGSGAKAML